MNGHITLTGTIEEIVYKNDDNGYTVCDIASKEEGLFTAVGYMAYISEGESISVTGSWTKHRDYGEQFKIEYYEVLLPTEEDAILRYLSSGIVYGVRQATAKKIVEAFGSDAFQIMLASPERLSEIKGISRSKAIKIGESFSQLQSMQNIVMFMQQYHVSANMAVKVYNIFGERAVEKIRENPYVLCDSVDGISFQVSDTIAAGQGLARNNPSRIRSGIKYILKNAAYTSGHTYMPSGLLVEHAAYKLNVEENEVENVLSELMLVSDIHQDRIDNTDVFYLSYLYTAEQYTAVRLAELSIEEPKIIMTQSEIDAQIEAVEKETGIILAPEQKNAVSSAVLCGCMVLTGGPGTGKTTTINTIIRVMEKLEYKIALAAPTGRAAKRMTQVTGLEAKTIHRLLGATPDGKFVHDESTPVKADVLILDEVSMVDINLMYSVLKAMKRGTKIILSGDADQLPSVGAGNVLRDIIASDVVPVIRLDRIFRQAEESLIVVNAHKINHGEMPELTDKSKDFFFLNRGRADDIAATIVDLYKNRLPKTYEVDALSSIQVLSPSKKGAAGVANINKILQQSMNPPSNLKPEYAYGNTVFRVGDKVMQIKNNYDIIYTHKDGEEGMGIFNGDMGVIESISSADKVMVITFDDDRQVEYPFNQLDELDLAYAITVHKSQGSEFPIVVMPVCNFAPMLMCRNLFYTAITRAKDMVVLVGLYQSVQYMIANNSERHRYTGLCEKMIETRNQLKALDEEDPFKESGDVV